MAFESVSIQSTRNGASLVVGFRQDLAASDVMLFSLTSTIGVTSARWELVGRPLGSAAGGLGPEPIVLTTGLTASLTVDTDVGSFKRDGSYKVQAVLNPGTPSETRKTVVVARLTGLTVPGPGGGSFLLRREAGFEALEDTSIPTTAQGWATQENAWKALVVQLTTGGGLTETLSAAYNNGAVSADQTLGLSDARGGGLVVDGSGVGFTGASAFRVATAALSPGLAVDRATGRVGIGTTSPAKQLQLTSTQPTIRLNDTDGVNFDLQNDASTLSILVGATTVATLPSTGGVRSDFGFGAGAAAPTAAALAMGAGSTAPVSVINTGRLRYNEVSQHFEVSENGGAYTTLSTGGGGGAPVGAQYLTLALDGTLTSERVFTTGNRLAFVDGGAGGNYTLRVVLNTGITGGDILAGGNGPGDSLTITSTTDITRGTIFIGTSSYDEVNNRLGIGTSSPVVALQVAGPISQAAIQLNDGESTPVSATSTGRIRYNASTQHFEISENANAWQQMSVGAGAPAGAQYLVLTNDAGLTAERAFVIGNRLNAVDGGANSSYTLSVVLSAGISGGDTLAGGTAASQNLVLTSTANATKGTVSIGTTFYDETNNRLGLGVTAPSVVLDVSGNNSRTAMAMTDGQSVAVSAASTGRLRYNANTQHWEASENGGAYARFTGSTFLGTAAGSILFTGATPFPIAEDDPRFTYVTGVFGGSSTMSRVSIGGPTLATSTSTVGSAVFVYSADPTQVSIIRLQGATAEVQGYQGTIGGGTGNDIPIGSVKFIDGANGPNSGAVSLQTRFTTGAIIEGFRAEGGGLVVGSIIMVGSSGHDESLNGQSAIQFQEHGTPATAPSGTARLRYRTTGGGGSNRLELSNTTGAYSPVATLADIGGAGFSFTAGSVIFSGGGAVLSQDNSQFFWDDTNHILKVANINPTADNTGSIGTALLRWSDIRTVSITTGDLNLGHGPEDEGEWILREGQEGIGAYNKRNGKWYDVVLRERA